MREISGFPELSPEEQELQRRVVERIFAILKNFGYKNFTTRMIQEIEVLSGRGIEDHEIYGLARINESGVRHGLRFDLTLPLIQYLNFFANQIVFPFRRAELGLVWRGERAQSGRFRCFHQLDFDVLMAKPDPIEIDLIFQSEILSVCELILRSVCPSAKLLVNDLGILRKFLSQFVASPIQERAVLRIIDNAQKISPDQWQKELEKSGLSTEHAKKIMKILEQPPISLQNSSELIDALSIFGDVTSNISEFIKIIEMAKGFGSNFDNVFYSPSIARGLDYYTSIVFEAVIKDENNAQKSVLAGGAYQAITKLYDGRFVSGIGGSVGVTRLVKSFKSHVNIDNSDSCFIVVCCDENSIEKCSFILSTIRQAGFEVMSSFSSLSNLRNQIKFSKMHNATIFITINGENIIVRNMISGHQENVGDDSSNIVDIIRLMK